METNSRVAELFTTACRQSSYGHVGISHSQAPASLGAPTFPTLVTLCVADASPFPAGFGGPRLTRQLGQRVYVDGDGAGRILRNARKALSSRDGDLPLPFRWRDK